MKRILTMTIAAAVGLAMSGCYHYHTGRGGYDNYGPDYCPPAPPAGVHHGHGHDVVKPGHEKPAPVIPVAKPKPEPAKPIAKPKPNGPTKPIAKPTKPDIKPTKPIAKPSKPKPAPAKPIAKPVIKPAKPVNPPKKH